MTFMSIPVYVEVETNDEKFIHFPTEIGASGTWYKGCPQTQLDPGEPEGYEVNSIRLDLTPDIHPYMLPSASICVYLEGRQFYCELPADYMDGDVIFLDSDGLEEAVTEWMNEYERGVV